MLYRLDGSSRGKSGLAGCDGVLSNEGSVIGLFFESLDTQESNFAELMGIKQASQMLVHRSW